MLLLLQARKRLNKIIQIGLDHGFDGRELAKKALPPKGYRYQQLHPTKGYRVEYLEV